MTALAVDRAVCRSIDHVMLRLSDPEPLFSLLTETLQLPVSWPLQHSEFARFAWVHVGNTHLELWSASQNGDLPVGIALPLIHGLALEPDDLSFSTAELERLGMACKPPRPFRTLDTQGQSVTNFTNSVVLDLSSPGCCNFFCEWGLQAAIVPWPQGVPTAERRAAEQHRFAAWGGGPLSLVGLARVRMVCPDVADMQGRWRTLAQLGEDVPLEVGGVALDLIAGDSHRIESLSLAVRSLVTARGFLLAENLLEKETVSTLTLCTRATGGLVIHLVEARPADPRT